MKTKIQTAAVLAACAFGAGRSGAFDMTAVAREQAVAQVRWESATGVVYAVEVSADPAVPEWTALAYLSGSPTSSVLNHRESAGLSSAWYRVADVTPPVPAGGALITYVPSPGNGNLAVRVATPSAPRYTNDEAAVVVFVDTFATGPAGLTQTPDLTSIGLVQVTYLWPGLSDPWGVRSEGVYDYGGTNGIRGLRDAIRFAAGLAANRDGFHLHELIAVRPRYDNVGLYAFSHPGIAAVNALGFHAAELTNVAWFVGRENPTVDTETAVEIGHWGEGNTPVLNPLYVYTNSYTPTNIALDYSSARWSAASNAPYFDLNGNDTPDAGDYVLGPRVPRLFGVRCYSVAMVNALAANGSLTNDASWPADLARPAQVESLWPYRSSAARYPLLAPLSNTLKALLLFARDDHVQPLPDKPHIHHAYEGFRFAAHCWTRLNPDKAYMTWANPALGAGAPDNPANQQPMNWTNAKAWAYANTPTEFFFAPCAAVAEMADRQFTTNWANDVGAVLVDYPSP